MIGKALLVMVLLGFRTAVFAQTGIGCQIQLRVVSPPLVGSELQITVPPGVIWNVLSVRAVLWTGSAVGPRQPLLEVTNASGNDAGRYTQDGTTNAGEVGDYTWGSGKGTSTMSWRQGYSTSFPSPLWLASGYKITSLTGGLQSSDSWMAVRYLVLECTGLQ